MTEVARTPCQATPYPLKQARAARNANVEEWACGEIQRLQGLMEQKVQAGEPLTVAGGYSIENAPLMAAKAKKMFPGFVVTTAPRAHLVIVTITEPSRRRGET